MENGKQKRAVIEKACAHCHVAKKKCDGVPCVRCAKLGCDCVEYVPKKRGPRPGKKALVCKSAALEEDEPLRLRGASTGLSSSLRETWQDLPVPSPSLLGLLLRYGASSMIVERPLEVASSLGLDVGANFIAVQFPAWTAHASVAEVCLGAVIMTCRCDESIPQLEGAGEYYNGKKIGEICIREKETEDMIENALRPCGRSVPHIRTMEYSKRVFSKSAKLFLARMRMTLLLDENSAPRYGFMTMLSAVDEPQGHELWDEMEVDSGGGWDLLDTSSDWFDLASPMSLAEVV